MNSAHGGVTKPTEDEMAGPENDEKRAGPEVGEGSVSWTWLEEKAGRNSPLERVIPVRGRQVADSSGSSDNPKPSS